MSSVTFHGWRHEGQGPRCLYPQTPSKTGFPCPSFVFWPLIHESSCVTMLFWRCSSSSEQLMESNYEMWEERNFGDHWDQTPNFSIFPAQYRDIKRFNQDHVAVRRKPGPNTDVLISRQPTTQRFPSLVSYFHTLLKVVHIPNGKWVKCDPKTWFLSFRVF